MDSAVPAIQRARTIRLASVLLTIATLLLAAAPAISLAAPSQNIDRDPREIALTEQEGGGKESNLVLEEDCSDDRSRCVYRRWERDADTDAAVGPIITVSKVWTARDVDAARAIYREQEAKQKDFPERSDYASGPFKFELPTYKFEAGPRTPPADEWTASSACVKNFCESHGRIDVHQRLVARKDSVVSLVYLFGRERNTTPALTIHFVTLTVERV